MDDKFHSRKILDTEMDRKEFLRYVGLLTVGLMGVSKLTSIYEKPLDKLKNKDTKTQGYGSSPYGK